MNGSAWIPVEHPQAIPSDRGSSSFPFPDCYQYFAWTSVPLPLEDLIAGENLFEFTSGDQECLSFGWGQWGAYSAIFRIYYDETEPHPTGQIVSPAYLEALHFDERLNGAFLIDDVSVVVGSAQTAIDESSSAVLPTELQLHANAPNPFNAETIISFDLPDAGEARLAVSNLAGQQVAQLIDRPLDAGHHTYRWNARTDDGRPLSTGVYLYRLEALGMIRSGKRLLLR
ncbi:MAG: FlgD immunoglobulin-like domain containing protein [Candidatus Latescibacterota bacterium]|nr:FlgD immunoglobulin-like domain containing protein [Candidatus Latescibacterota bacterium]MED5416752.1 FlgD immunoglobulin-like domain containing protein [Candidatus Latescibacterota bacterium]MEE3043302.1 FlgD immunoglobulin-like domain containing protein [Candidatus Latescibacterota bacterium]